MFERKATRRLSYVVLLGLVASLVYPAAWVRLSTAVVWGCLILVSVWDD